MKKLVIGFIVGVLLTSGIAYAADSQYLLSLFEVKLVFNGTEKQGSDKPYQYYNGQTYVPTSLIYNGTTYVPLRFFSETSGLPVKYEGKDKTIFIGKIPEDGKIETSMSDILQPYYKSNGGLYSYSSNEPMKLSGKEYSKGYKIYRHQYNSSDVSLSYNLEGKYTSISGIIGLDDENNQADTTVMLYADEKLLDTIDLKAGSLQQNFKLDVTGVVKFDIKILSGSGTVDFANVMIK